MADLPKGIERKEKKDYNLNMGKILKSIGAGILSIFAIAGTILIPGCTSIKIAEYPAANKAFMYEKDDSVPFADIFSAPSNPDRGFRGEAYITLGSGEAYPGSGENAYAYLDECLKKYSAEGIKLMQIYVYLKEYCNESLPESALGQLREYLEYLNGKGVKALLRFAYESSGSDEKGPRTRDILEHLQTLKGFFDENAELIDRTVYAFQLGLIGLWGEGHGSVHNLSKRKIIKAAFETFPSDMFVMVRTPELLSLVPSEYERRAGLHDDYMIGYSHEWGMMDYSDENYPKLLNKCKYALTDGELPWGDQSPDGMNTDGIIAQAVGYGLSSLSIEHNYIEDGNEYLIKQWQSVYIDETYLKDKGYPYNPALLTDGKISVFDYLKHHLGYQISVSNYSEQNGKAKFLITNYGFAAPHGYALNVYVNGEKVYSSALDDLNIFSERYVEYTFGGGETEVEIINLRSGETALPYNKSSEKLKFIG